jgi:hypothetical protein
MLPRLSQTDRYPCALAEVTGPLLIYGIVILVGVMRLEPRVGEGVLSRVLPLRPLGHQAARYGAHLSPSLRAPAHRQTHLDSITSLITFPIYVTSFHVCVLLVILILYYAPFI